jgi:hypothetical protein
MQPPDWSDTKERRLREAETRLTAHEDVCTERYQRIRDDFSDFRSSLADAKKEISNTNHLLVKLGVGLLGGMATILATIVFFK